MEYKNPKDMALDIKKKQNNLKANPQKNLSDDVKKQQKSALNVGKLLPKLGYKNFDEMRIRKSQKSYRQEFDKVTEDKVKP